MSKPIDLVGMKFGRWTVLEYAEYKNGVMWLCRCTCGTEKKVRSDHLRYGKSTSCGCYRNEVTTKETARKNEKHGMYNTRLYRIWRGMKQRCSDKCPIRSAKSYYAKGIRVCDEWKNDFRVFAKWAIENVYEENKSIDRINVDGNYEPSNCRWATAVEQARNKSDTLVVEYNGERRPLREWAEVLGINYSTLATRLRRGKSPEEVLKK